MMQQFSQDDPRRPKSFRDRYDDDVDDDVTSWTPTLVSFWAVLTLSVGTESKPLLGSRLRPTLTVVSH